mgnify:CR=1 FL=1
MTSTSFKTNSILKVIIFFAVGMLINAFFGLLGILLLAYAVVLIGNIAHYAVDFKLVFAIMFLIYCGISLMSVHIKLNANADDT